MADLVKSLSEVFSNKVFFIPDYQRGYAWAKKQWEDLIQDLELLPENRMHFIGTLIITKSKTENGKTIDEEGRVYIPFDVIDGQQRLTTTVLFLKAIHETMMEVESLRNLANGLREMYLTNLDLNQQPFAKLTLNRDSKEFFINNILAISPTIQGPTIRSHHLLLQGKEHFKSYIEKQKDLQGKSFGIWLQRTYFKLTQQLSLIVYEVDSELDAGVIFETMNDRGRPLTELEKVKNYLLYVSSKLDLPAGHNLDQRINQTWTRIFEELMAAGLSDSTNEDQLLRDHWLTVYDYNPQNWNQSRTIKDKFNLREYYGKNKFLLVKINDYLDTLQNCTIAYCDLYQPFRLDSFNDINDKAIRNEIIKYSQKISRLGSRASFHPILLATRMKAKDNGKLYLDVAKLCEKFDFRVYQWLRKQSRAGQSQLFKLGYDFYQNANSASLINGIIQTIYYYCSNNQFNQRFDNDTENWYQWGGLKYFLYEYEQFNADQAGVPIKMPWDFLQKSAKEDTIEHILPQTPVDDFWKTRFDSSELERWTDDIGNLTLTYDNSPMSNKPFKKGIKKFDDKISYYENSNLLIERCLKDYSDWDVTSIQKRRNQIKDWAIDRWEIDESKIPKNETPIKVQRGKLPTNELKKLYFQNFIRISEKYGNSKEFQELIDIAKKFPLYLYLNPYYQGVSFNLPNHRITSMIWIDPKNLYVSVNLDEFDQHFNLLKGETAKIIGEKTRILMHNEVPEFKSRLQLLLDKISTQ